MMQALDVKEAALVDQRGALLLLSRRLGDRLVGWDRAGVRFVAREALDVPVGPSSHLSSRGMG